MYLLAVFAPFLGSASAGLFGRFIGSRGSGIITVIGMFVSFLGSTLIYYEVGLQGSPVYITLGDWFSVSSVNVCWSMYFDSLTACMMFTVTMVSLCVHIYSLGYMQTDPHLPRFMSYLSLFTFFMLLLVSADNMLQMLVGFEGIGVCSFLLISFWFHRLSATKSAIKAMLVNRVSDTFLMISIMLMWWYMGSTDFTVLAANGMKAAHIDYICFFLLLGVLGKSAQIGLHTWLPDPTPVSALIHAATLVTAGVYIIARTGFLWEYSEFCRMCLTFVGALTSIMAATCGLFQNDMKRVIAYSTCSQLGYMMVSLGLSHYALAIYHLMTHACFKALLFLSAGVVIHAVADVQDMRRHGGVMRLLPWVWGTMLLGTLSLVGWPFLSGYFSKDSILEYSWASWNSNGIFAYYCLVVVAFFTSFYSFRLLWCSFLSDVSSRHNELPSGSTPMVMWVPLLFLSIGSIWLGYFSVDMLIGMGTDFWSWSINPIPTTGQWVSCHFMPITVAWFPFMAVLLGLLGSFFYSWPMPWCTIAWLRTLYLFTLTRWQFDIVYNQQIAKRVLDWGSSTWVFIDKGILELLGPRGISYTVFNKYVPAFKKFQTGTVHDYAIIYKVCVLLGMWLLVADYSTVPMRSLFIVLLVLATAPWSMWTIKADN
nr:NADH dehydrogenase subunit 5 [Oedogonium sp. BN3]